MPGHAVLRTNHDAARLINVGGAPHGVGQNGLQLLARLVQLRKGLPHVGNLQERRGEPGEVGDRVLKLRKRNRTKLEHLRGLASLERLQDAAQRQHQQVPVGEQQPVLDQLAHELRRDGQLPHRVLGEVPALGEEDLQHPAKDLVVARPGRAGLHVAQQLDHLVAGHDAHVEVVVVPVHQLVRRHTLRVVGLVRRRLRRLAGCVGRNHHGLPRPERRVVSLLTRTLWRWAGQPSLTLIIPVAWTCPAGANTGRHTATVHTGFTVKDFVCTLANPQQINKLGTITCDDTPHSLPSCSTTQGGSRQAISVQTLLPGFHPPGRAKMVCIALFARGSRPGPLALSAFLVLRRGLRLLRLAPH
ncbi:DegT/DnrJ/EryC1/StrS family aminotransferase [Babesia caballi]|uniref:DegT/DnrJ/EryC1/StrS family aminotransferase n=1 Tax=Babesia caballi TaxID=5871 RepID=A0AAV4M3I9_BABCB|nr:DegT/DnrJ/EryC1/StrS family aminotransferase [Babesia caballi]